MPAEAGTTRREARFGGPFLLWSEPTYPALCHAVRVGFFDLSHDPEYCLCMDELHPNPRKPMVRTGIVLAALGAGLVLLSNTDGGTAAGFLIGAAAGTLGVLLLGIGWLVGR